MSPEDISKLFDYNAWANKRTLDSCEALSGDQFTKQIVSSFPSVRDTLAHIWGAEWLWLERFQGISPSALPAVGLFGEISALRAHWREDETRLLNFVRGLTQADLDRVIEYKTLNFGVYKNPLWQSMQHMVNHGTYHRGQITTMLRQLGAKPLQTDLIHYYRERAAASASA
jgi:uncharacterized damage-inducible protein DinB